MVLVPTTSAPMARGVVSISRWGGGVGPSLVICKLALAVERVLTSSATIKWKPGPQVESIPSEKVALPCASVVIDELPLIEIGSWISWVNATRVEGEKCLSVTCTVLPGEAALEESVKVGNPPVPPVDEDLKRSKGVTRSAVMTRAAASNAIKRKRRLSR